MHDTTSASFHLRWRSRRLCRLRAKRLSCCVRDPAVAGPRKNAARAPRDIRAEARRAGSVRCGIVRLEVGQAPSRPAARPAGPDAKAGSSRGVIASHAEDDAGLRLRLELARQAFGSMPAPVHSVAWLTSTRLILAQSVPARSKRATLVLPAGSSLKSSTVSRSTTPASLNSAISKAALVSSAPRLLVTTKVSRQPLSDGCAPLSSSMRAGEGRGGRILGRNGRGRGDDTPRPGRE